MSKDKMIELKAEVLKALGHPTRLAIVEMLAEGEKCVCKINEQINADSSTISKHLSVLKKAGILSDRKNGLNVFYRLEVPCVMKFIGCIASVIETRVKKELEALKTK